MGLTRVQHTRVGDEAHRGISGGEMKRLSIAVEIVNLPALVCCDEPTSGLDSATAADVMRAINNLAALNRTVITTIHQPSPEIFALFDRLLLLAGGKPVFFGPAAAAAAHFSRLGGAATLSSAATSPPSVASDAAASAASLALSPRAAANAAGAAAAAAINRGGAAEHSAASAVQKGERRFHCCLFRVRLAVRSMA
ncbi:P-loop containing nucleoside triphosphate hydrolase protein [Tribonema minus]|uniref:P-loop containing nucleoside triphosphate hydrolase protein n=1 Tax=Tribonema minus TaxID=303371 RepID=A0A836CHI0_9STRA|nr:P-loop containing nucleoside triphosphate hydrolase protein [Tribonema minus]